MVSESYAHGVVFCCFVSSVMPVSANGLGIFLATCSNYQTNK